MQPFKKQVKNLHKNQKQILDEAIKEVMANPTIGQMKKGDLADIRVYKFKILNQLYLLAYKISNDNLELVLVALGVHENFYRDLKH